MKADVYFECQGQFIPALIREIKFTTVRGAERALINLINKMHNTLYLQYGSNKAIDVIATIPGQTKRGEYFLKMVTITNFGLV